MMRHAESESRARRLTTKVSGFLILTMVFLLLFAAASAHVLESVAVDSAGRPIRGLKWRDLRLQEPLDGDDLLKFWALRTACRECEHGVARLIDRPDRLQVSEKTRRYRCSRCGRMFSLRRKMLSPTAHTQVSVAAADAERSSDERAARGGDHISDQILSER